MRKNTPRNSSLAPGIAPCCAAFKKMFKFMTDQIPFNELDERLVAETDHGGLLLLRQPFPGGDVVLCPDAGNGLFD